MQLSVYRATVAIAIVPTLKRDDIRRHQYRFDARHHRRHGGVTYIGKMQKAAASLSAYLPAALRGSSSAASGSGSGSRSGIGLGLGLGLGLSSDDESKRYIQLPTLAPGDGPHIGGRTSSDSFTSQLSPRILHPAGKRRFRLALIVGGVVAVVMLVGAARHTGALESGARALRGSGSGGNVYVTTEWEGAEEDRPARWGWTEEMGWMEDESSMWLGDGEGAYRLGFGKGMDGTEWYVCA